MNIRIKNNTAKTGFAAKLGTGITFKIPASQCGYSMKIQFTTIFAHEQANSKHTHNKFL